MTQHDAVFAFFPMIWGSCCCLTIPLIIFWIWMLVDCVQNEPSEAGKNDKLIWILVIIFTGWIGALIYLLVRRPQRKALYGK